MSLTLHFRYLELESDVLRDRLIERGRMFEQLCNGPPEGCFRQYGGVVMNEGADEVLADVNNEVRFTQS